MSPPRLSRRTTPRLLAQQADVAQPSPRGRGRGRGKSLDPPAHDRRGLACFYNGGVL